MTNDEMARLIDDVICSTIATTHNIPDNWLLLFRALRSHHIIAALNFQLVCDSFHESMHETIERLQQLAESIATK